MRQSVNGRSSMSTCSTPNSASTACSFAAEIQQNLLPPRIARIAGATLAGNVIPGYEIGGDWFDYAENPSGTWIGIADSDGSGPRAAGRGAVILGAFRAVRRNSDDPAQCIQEMHQVLLELDHRHATASATIGFWNAVTSTLKWVSAGNRRPLALAADGRLQPLDGALLPEIGTAGFPSEVTANQTRLIDTERLLLLSDGVMPDTVSDSREAQAITASIKSTQDRSAAATVWAIEQSVRELSPDHLSDDATLVVLAPLSPQT